MKTKVNSILKVETFYFQFRFACEDCVHLDQENQKCMHGYTEVVHRSDLDEKFMAFCKEFELGQPSKE